MIQENKNIDYEWLTRPTGDPFVDAGGIVIKYFSEINPKKGILDIIEEITKIYVNNWGGKLNAFFLNSTITQSAFKGPRKIDETMKFFKELINEQKEFKLGFCRITGRKTHLFYAGRDNHVLSGSKTFINFHHAYETGLFVSKEVLIRVFFIPFGLLQLSGKIALIQSNNLDVFEYFIRKNCSNNLSGLSSSIAKGVLKSEFKNPSNALFSFADSCISDLKIATYKEDVDKTNIKDTSLGMYHFTNFGASPEVQLYEIRSTVFAFYATCLHPKLKKDWQPFIQYHYSNSKFKNASFDDVTYTWQSGKEVAEYSEYKVWQNQVYEKLLNNQSIVSEILRWSKQRKFNFRIVEYYQIYLRNMEQRTLEKIKELADFIVNKQETDKVKKSITRLNGSKSSHDVRYFLLRLIDKNYQDKNEQPLITLDDYVQYLFPDGVNWREIRDLLLIAVYQKLHENQISLELELTENEEETINE